MSGRHGHPPATSPLELVITTTTACGEQVFDRSGGGRSSSISAADCILCTRHCRRDSEAGMIHLINRRLFVPKTFTVDLDRLAALERTGRMMRGYQSLVAEHDKRAQ